MTGVMWFYAVDNPIDPSSVVKTTTTSAFSTIHPTPAKAKASTTWMPFSKRDAEALEKALQSHDTSVTVPVNEDKLFEVRVFYRTLSPIYWEGPVYPVRRALWFMQSDGSKWIPCEEVLGQQIEAGYRKYKPYETFAHRVNGEQTGVVEDMTLAEHPVEQQWNLLGPYLGQYVAYTGANTARLLSNSASSKLAKSIITRLTNKQNLGGIRLVRGYENVKDKPKSSSPQPGTESREQHPDDGIVLEESEGAETDADRKIDHLVFVIPGAGQRFLGQNFIKDVDKLRRSIKYVYPAAIAATSTPSRPNGIQVLPIPWRQEINFRISAKDTERTEADLGMPGADDGFPTLDELTIDSVPNIRNLVSDVVIDIPLYLTPKYREQMTAALCKLINKVFLRFVRRNPDFLERDSKVSIIGHSLGSTLAFDMLCMQPMTQPPSMQQIASALKQPQMMQRYTSCSSLIFPVQNFFGLGAPTGVMLLLKGYRIASRKSLQSSNTLRPVVNSTSRTPGVQYCHPAVENLYNIFHKSDPVAYRLEPLISRQYGSSLKPEPMPYNKELLKKAEHASARGAGSSITDRAGAMYESFKIGVATNLVLRGLGLTRQQIYDDMHSSSKDNSDSDGEAEGDITLSYDDIIHRKHLGISHARSSSDSAIHAMAGGSTRSRRSGSSSPRRTPPTPLDLTGRFSEGARRLSMLNVTGRVDYCLQDGQVENPYWNAFGAHFQYWEDLDVAAFLVRELYR